VASTAIRPGIRAGDLRHRISIEKRSSAQDASGGQLLAWASFASVRASVEPLVGREWESAQQRTARVTTRFRVRYLAGVLPSMRIVWDGRFFDVKDVLQVRGIHHELVIMAEEVVGRAP
jgi:SPP1 family predicted phage head-tail adaptor